MKVQATTHQVREMQKRAILRLIEMSEVDKGELLKYLGLKSMRSLWSFRIIDLSKLSDLFGIPVSDMLDGQNLRPWICLKGLDAETLKHVAGFRKLCEDYVKVKQLCDKHKLTKI